MSKTQAKQLRRLIHVSQWLSIYATQLNDPEKKAFIQSKAKVLYKIIIKRAKKYNDPAHPQHTQFKEIANETLTHLITTTPTVSSQSVPSLIPWQKNQKALQDLRKRIEKKLKDKPLSHTFEIVDAYNKALCQYAGDFFEQSITEQGVKLHHEYVVLATGSMGRKDACPRSDIEYIVLIDEAGKKTPEPFRMENTLRLFELIFIALTETPAKLCPDPRVGSGLHFDDVGYIAFSNIMGVNADGRRSSLGFWGTVKKFLQYIINRDLQVSTMLLSTTILAASTNGKQLYSQLQNGLIKQLEENIPNTKMTYSQHLFSAMVTANVESFKPRLGKVVWINVKEVLLRLPTFLLMGMAICHRIYAESSLERLNKLSSLGHIDPAVGGLLKIYLMLGLNIRFQAHLHYRAEKETAYFDEPKDKNHIASPFILSKEIRKYVIYCQQSLVPYLYQAFVEKKIILKKFDHKISSMFQLLSGLPDFCDKDKISHNDETASGKKKMREIGGKPTFSDNPSAVLVRRGGEDWDEESDRKMTFLKNLQSALIKWKPKKTSSVWVSSKNAQVEALKKALSPIDNNPDEEDINGLFSDAYDFLKKEANNQEKIFGDQFQKLQRYFPGFDSANTKERKNEF